MLWSYVIWQKRTMCEMIQLFTVNDIYMDPEVVCLNSLRPSDAYMRQ